MGSTIYEEVRLALHAVWQRRWLALGVAWGICLIGWLVVSQMPNRYEARARVFVQARTVLPGTGAAQADQARDIDRIRQTLTSAVNLEKVVRGTEIAQTVRNDRDVADRVASLQRVIKITPGGDNLFEIAVTMANPGAGDAANARLAAAIVAKLIDIFVAENVADARDDTGQSLQFLDNQLAQRQGALQAAEAKRAAFQQGYLGRLPGTGTLEERMATARAQLSQIDGDLAAAQSSLSAVNAQMAGTAPNLPGAPGTAPAAGPARARVAAIQGQLAEARGRGWTDNHPDVVALRAQLAMAQSAAVGEPAGASAAAANPNPLYLSLRAMQADRAAQVAALRERRGAIARDMAGFDARVAARPGVAAEQIAIDRDYAVLKDQYDKLLADREQVSLRNQAQTETSTLRFSVIDPPTVPRTPAAPNRPLLLTAVLVLGLGGGMAAAWAMGQLRTTFAVASRLEKASGLVVLGQVGEAVSAAQVALRRQRLRLYAGGVGALAAAWLLLMGLEFAGRGGIA